MGPQLTLEERCPTIPVGEVLFDLEGRQWPAPPSSIKLATPCADEMVVTATPLFCDAFCKVSAAVQRAVQRRYHREGWSPEVMLDCLELMACDVALREEMRHDLVATTTQMRAAGIATPTEDC